MAVKVPLGLVLLRLVVLVVEVLAVIGLLVEILTGLRGQSMKETAAATEVLETHE